MTIVFLGRFIITMKTGADREGQSSKLRCAHLHMPIDDKTADQAERNLRDDEPEPVDAIVEDRANNAQRRVEDAGPHKRSDEASGKNRLSRKHRQHSPVEQADEHRGETVNCSGCKEPFHMKLRQKFIALTSPTDKPASSEQIYRIPDAVVTNKAKERRWNDHRNAANDAAPDARR